MSTRARITPASEETREYSRTFHLGEPEYLRDSGEHHQAIIEWLESNNISPDSLPLTQVIIISSELIQFTQFVFNREGAKQLHLGGRFGGIWDKTVRVVPVIKYPEEFGL